MKHMTDYHKKLCIEHGKQIAVLESELARVKAMNDVATRVHAAFIEDGCLGDYVLGACLWREFDSIFSKGEGKG